MPGRRRGPARRRGARRLQRGRAARGPAGPLPGRRLGRAGRCARARALARRHRRGRGRARGAHDRADDPARRLARGAPRQRSPTPTPSAGRSSRRRPAAADWAEYFCRYARDMRPFAAARVARPAGRQRRLQARAAPRRRGELPRRVLGAGGPRGARGARRSASAHAGGRRRAGTLGRRGARSCASGSQHGREYGTQRGRDGARPRRTSRDRARGRRPVPPASREPSRMRRGRGRRRSLLACCPRSSRSTSRGRPPRRAGTWTCCGRDERARRSPSWSRR